MFLGVCGAINIAIISLSAGMGRSKSCERDVRSGRRQSAKLGRLSRITHGMTGFVGLLFDCIVYIRQFAICIPICACLNATMLLICVVERMLQVKRWGLICRYVMQSAIPAIVVGSLFSIRGKFEKLTGIFGALGKACAETSSSIVVKYLPTWWSVFVFLAGISVLLTVYNSLALLWRPSTFRKGDRVSLISRPGVSARVMGPSERHDSTWVLVNAAGGEFILAKASDMMSDVGFCLALWQPFRLCLYLLFGSVAVTLVPAVLTPILSLRSSEVLTNRKR